MYAIDEIDTIGLRSKSESGDQQYWHILFKSTVRITLFNNPDRLTKCGNGKNNRLLLRLDEWPETKR